MAAGANQKFLVSEQVFDTLLQALLTGRYAPGEKLPTQRALAAELDVTMSSLREALKRLEQMGLVDVRHGDAMRVRDWREFGGLDVITHLLFRPDGIDRSLLGDIFEARGRMLETIAELAAERRSEDQRAELDRIALELSATSDAAVAQALDFEFFSEIARAAGNVVFLLIMNGIRSLYFERAALLPVTVRPEELAPLYTSAAAAIGERDTATARDVVGRLAARQRERVEEAIARWG